MWSQAWAGSFDGILHKDIGGVNARLAAECNTYGKGFLVPFGSINPKLPDWQEDVRRCAKDYKMPGIRLHPNYHGYELKDPIFAELLQVAAANGLMVQLVVSMEDIRTAAPADASAACRSFGAGSSGQEPAFDPVDSAELVAGAEVNSASGRWRMPVELYFDISMVEGIEGVARLVEQLPAERVLFGSNFPLFYFEAALLKVEESGLPEVKKTMLFEGNARRILPPKAA